MLLALAVLSLAAQVAPVEKPKELASTDPKERIAAIVSLAKEPPNEVRGQWLFEATADKDPSVQVEAIKVWPSYEDGFCAELRDAIDEGVLDGRAFVGVAQSIDDWRDT